MPFWDAYVTPSKVVRDLAIGDKRSRLESPGTLRQTNMAMNNGPFEEVFPIKNGDFPLPC